MNKQLEERIAHVPPTKFLTLKAGVSVIDVPASSKVIKEDVYGFEVEYVMHKGNKCEVMKRTGNKISIRVSKDKEKFARPFSPGYFIYPDNYIPNLGFRSDKIRICLPIKEEITEIFDSKHKKFRGKTLYCFGDGETASRLNSITNKYEEVKCICAHSKHFKLNVINEVSTDFANENYTKVKINKFNKAKDEYEEVMEYRILTQGALREVQKVNKELKTVELKPIKPSCEDKYYFNFYVPKLPTLDYCDIKGSGIRNSSYLYTEINKYRQMFLGRRNFIDLDLSIEMVNDYIPVIGQTLSPFFRLNSPFGIEELSQQAKSNKQLEQ